MIDNQYNRQSTTLTTAGIQLKMAFPPSTRASRATCGEAQETYEAHDCDKVKEAAGVERSVPQAWRKETKVPALTSARFTNNASDHGATSWITFINCTNRLIIKSHHYFRWHYKARTLKLNLWLCGQEYRCPGSKVHSVTFNNSSFCRKFRFCPESQPTPARHPGHSAFGSN